MPERSTSELSLGVVDSTRGSPSIIMHVHAIRQGDRLGHGRRSPGDFARTRAEEVVAA